MTVTEQNFKEAVAVLHSEGLSVWKVFDTYSDAFEGIQRWVVLYVDTTKRAKRLEILDAPNGPESFDFFGWDL